MSEPFDRDQLLRALDRIGAAAVLNREHLEIAVYGDSALMLAGNFRYSSEDVDIAAIDRPWPLWLDNVVAALARENGWADDWLNDAVGFHLSPLANAETDHLAFGDFPRGPGEKGLKVYVPSAEYLLALKLKAIRVADPVKGPREAAYILNLSRLLKLETPEAALEILARYFPKSAGDASKRRFLLQHIWNKDTHDAPRYAGRGG